MQEASPASIFNAELLYGIALAWGEACDCLRDMIRQIGPAGRIATEQLYNIIPATETMTAESTLAHSDAWLSKEIAANVSAFDIPLHCNMHLGPWTVTSLLMLRGRCTYLYYIFSEVWLCSLHGHMACRLHTSHVAPVGFT